MIEKTRLLWRPLTICNRGTIKESPLGFQQGQLMSVSSENTLQKQKVGLELQGEGMKTSIPKASKHQIDSAQRVPIPKGCKGSRKQSLARAVSRQTEQMIIGVRGAQRGVLIVSTEMKLSVRKRVSTAMHRDQGGVRVRPTPRSDVLQSTNEMLHMHQ